MSESDRANRLHDIVDTMLGRVGKNFLARYSDPFDVTPPNQHESKQEFLAEKSAVEASLRHIEGLLAALVASDSDDQEKRAALIRVRENIDEGARKRAPQRNIESANGLITRNAMEKSIYYHALVMCIEMDIQLKERLSTLVEQEREFWSIAHRAPNYRARFLALRLARIFAQHHGKKPTVGTSRDGGHPSTAYTRALEEVFLELEIKADVRRAASWAVEQLTDDDMKPPASSLFGGLLGLGALGGSLTGTEPTIGELLSDREKG